MDGFIDWRAAPPCWAKCKMEEPRWEKEQDGHEDGAGPK